MAEVGVFLLTLTGSDFIGLPMRKCPGVMTAGPSAGSVCIGRSGLLLRIALTSTMSVELGVCETLRSKFLFELLLHLSHSYFPEPSEVRRSCWRKMPYGCLISKRVVKLMLKSFRLHQAVDFFQLFSCTNKVAAIVTIDMTGCTSVIDELLEGC